jgi:signal transduction histidine kinase
VNAPGTGLATRQAVGAHPGGHSWKWKIKGPLLAGVSSLFVVWLWMAGYPAWRTAAVAFFVLANIVRNIVFKHAVIPEQVAQAPDCNRPNTMAWQIGLASQFVMAALSGGLRSPLLVCTMGPMASMVLVYGWSQDTKKAMGITAAGALSLIVLPAAWFGPSVPEPWFSRLAGLALFSVAFFHGSYLVAMTRALHEVRTRAERAREQMAQEAIARARELENLSAQLSHELKNPLGAIKALVQLSRKDACDELSRERLEVAEHEVERMNGILTEYLSFSRPLDRLKRESLSLAALADEVIELLAGQAASAGVSLRRVGEAPVEADPRRLREALFNLVSNALDATARDGTVEICIDQRDGSACVEVRDSGRGMTREVLERVGTPFFTTREQGTGLGVAMARAAFAQHGGSLEYRSEEGRGTTATGTLPLRERSQGGAAAPG